MINEALSTPESKKRFIELIKKYHPDTGGDIKIAQRINSAKDDGDYAIDRLYQELTGRKVENVSGKQKYYDFMKQRREERQEDLKKKYGEKVEKTINMVKMWLDREPFVSFFDENKIDFDIEVNEDNGVFKIDVVIDQRRGKKFKIEGVGTPKCPTADALYAKIHKEIKPESYGIKQKISQMKQWLLQPRFSELFNDNSATYKVFDDDSSGEISMTITKIRNGKRFYDTVNFKKNITEDDFFHYCEQTLLNLK